MAGEEEPERALAEEEIHAAHVAARIAERREPGDPASAGVVGAAPILRAVGARDIENLAFTQPAAPQPSTWPDPKSWPPVMTAGTVH